MAPQLTSTSTTTSPTPTPSHLASLGNDKLAHMMVYPGLLRIIITISSVLGFIAIAMSVTLVYRLRRRRNVAAAVETEAQKTATAQRPTFIVRLDSYASIASKTDGGFITPSSSSPSLYKSKNPFLSTGAGESEVSLGTSPSSSNPSLRRPHTTRMDSFTLPGPTSFTRTYGGTLGVGKELKSVPEGLGEGRASDEV